MSETTQFTNTDDWRATRGLEKSAGFLVPYVRPGMKIIDLGCGPGSITCDIAEAVAPGEVIGVDVSERVLERARGIAAERGVKNVRFELGDGNQLQYADGTFDGAFESQTLAYIGRPMKPTREVFRVLKAGAFFAAQERDYNGDLFGNVNSRVLAAWRMDYRSYKKLDSIGLDLSIGGRIRSMLLRAGFENAISTANYENHGDQEGARWIAAFYTRNFDNDEYVRDVVAAGLATKELLQKWKDAWKAWGEDPRSFYSLARTECIAWKPKS